VRYAERLSVPVAWWVLALLAVVSLWLAYDVSLGPQVALPVAGLALVGLGAWLGRLSSLEVRVGAEGLTVGAAHLPVSAVGRVEVLRGSSAQAARGRDADPHAYYAVRGYVPDAVRVWVEDPGDPVPFWLVSSRRAEDLARVLTGVRDSGGASG
jgi:hypothetical protein